MRSTPHRRVRLRGVVIALVTAAAIGTNPTIGYAQPPAGLARSAPDDLDRLIARASAQLEVATEHYDAVRADLAASWARVGILNRDMAGLAEQVTQGQARTRVIAVRAYETGLPADASTVLAANSPADFLDRLQLLDRAAAARDRQLRQLLAQQRALALRRRQLDAAVLRGTAQEHAAASLRETIRAQLRHLDQIRSRVGGQILDRRPATRSQVRLRPARSPTRARASDDRGLAAVRFAFGQLGKWYQFGADGPDTYDCSGLTMAAWRTAGVYLPHNAARQWSSVSHIDRSHLRQGDLVFYYRDIHHVAVYIGEGQVIHAPGPGERVQRAPVDLAPIYGLGRPG
jgi:peptidoglycan DL-endopeptidase CwlO